jgi:hypothetical protein
LQNRFYNQFQTRELSQTLPNPERATPAKRVGIDAERFDPSISNVYYPTLFEPLFLGG